MGPTANKGVVIFILISASLFSVSMGSRDWRKPKVKSGPRKIIVGGKAKWTYGFDYFTWSFTFDVYVNDSLIFKYDPPVKNKTPPHNVVLFPTFEDYGYCNVTAAKVLADVSDGGGKGFEYKITKQKGYQFGSTIGNDCVNGSMRFFVWPHLK